MSLFKIPFRPTRIGIPSARSISAPAVITPAAPSILDTPAAPTLLDSLSNGGPVEANNPMPLPEIPQKSIDTLSPVPLPPKAPMLGVMNNDDEDEDDFPDTMGFEYEDDEIFDEYQSSEFFGSKKKRKARKAKRQARRTARKTKRAAKRRKLIPNVSNGESPEDFVMPDFNWPQELPVNEVPFDDNSDFEEIPAFNGSEGDDLWPEEDYGFDGSNHMGFDGFGMTEEEEDFLGINKKNLKKFGKGIGKAGKKIGKAAKKFGTFAAKVGVSAMGADPSLVDGKRQREDYGYEAPPLPDWPIVVILLKKTIRCYTWLLVRLYWYWLLCF